MVHLIRIQRNEPSLSGWYNQQVDYIDYFIKYNNFKYALGGVAVRIDGTKPEDKKDSMYLVMDYYDRIKEIKTRAKQLKQNNYKYFCNYCGAGFKGSPNKFNNVFKFISWVKKEGFKFNEFYRIEYIKDLDCFEFGGNLDKYSCAFSFRIFDKETVEKIRELTKELI